MTRFLIDTLPRPVLTQPLDNEATKAQLLGEYVDIMRARGNPYDVEDSESDPAVIAAEVGAVSHTYIVALINDAARVVLLPSQASGSDLELHAARTGLVRLEGESDVALRERMRLSWKGKSAAGPDDYYKSAARNFDPRVIDVAVTAETRNASSRVLILSVLTSDNDGVLDDALRAGLTTALNDPSFRSRNVTVEIIPAVITTKNVEANLYLYPETPESVADQAKLALIAAARRDQSLGFDITRSYVDRQLHLSGVQRVDLPGWQDANAEFNEAIALGTVTINVIRLL